MLQKRSNCHNIYFCPGHPGGYRDGRSRLADRDRQPARETTVTTKTTMDRPDAPPARLMSLDALRGFDMFWILGAESLVAALQRMKPCALTNLLANQLQHARWEGFHCYDLIFPLFVFLMGVATVFSLTRVIERHGRAVAVRRVVWRGAGLFVLGLIYSGGLTNPWPDLRLMGVLNRIALCYTAGGLLFIFLPLRGLVAVAAALLLGYGALLAWVPFPDVRPPPGGQSEISLDTGFTNSAQLNFASAQRLRGSWRQGLNLADYVDERWLPGRKYDGTHDPEGLLSTLPAIASGLLGIFASCLLRHPRLSPGGKAGWLLAGGGLCAFIGWAWGIELPVIKKIWTPSFVLVSGGCSAMLLGAFYWVVDVRGWRAWCQPWVWVGMNPLALYLTANLLGGAGFEKLARRLAGGSVQTWLNAHVAAGSGDLLLALTGIALFLGLARFLHQRRLYLRL